MSGSVFLFSRPSEAATQIVPRAFNAGNSIQTATQNGWNVGGNNYNLNSCSPTVTPCMITDGSGNSRLRLVNKDTILDRGYALYNIPQTTTSGIDISFNAAIYEYGGSAQADGLVFYLKDGSDTKTGPSSLGASGGSMGYSSTSTNKLDGLSGALLGVGFDAYGNFYHLPFASEDCANDPAAPGWTDEPHSPRSLIIRGAQGVDRKSGYCRIATSADRLNLIQEAVTAPSSITSSNGIVMNPYTGDGGASTALFLGKDAGSNQVCASLDGKNPVITNDYFDPSNGGDSSSWETYYSTACDEVSTSTDEGGFAVHQYRSPTGWQTVGTFVDGLPGYSFESKHGDRLLSVSDDGTRILTSSNQIINRGENVAGTSWNYFDSASKIQMSFTANNTTSSKLDFYSPGLIDEIVVNVNTDPTLSHPQTEFHWHNLSTSEHSDCIVTDRASGSTGISGNDASYSCNPSVSTYSTDSSSTFFFPYLHMQTSTEAVYMNMGVDLTDLGALGGNDLFANDGSGVRIRIKIDPSDTDQGSYGTGYVYFGSAGDSTPTHEVTRFPLPKELHDAHTFKFGFVAGTGGGATNIDIWKADVATLVDIQLVHLSQFSQSTPWNACESGSATFTVVEGIAPYVLDVSGLPSGLSVSDASNAGVYTISGKPTSPGTYSVTVGISDSGSPPNSTSGSISLFITDANACVTTSQSLNWELGGSALSSSDYFATNGNSITLLRTFVDIPTDAGQATLLRASLNVAGGCGSFVATSNSNALPNESNTFTLDYNLVNNLSRGYCYQWTYDPGLADTSVIPLDSTGTAYSNLTSPILVVPHRLLITWPSVIKVDPRARYVQLPGLSTGVFAGPTPTTAKVCIAGVTTGTVTAQTITGITNELMRLLSTREVSLEVAANFYQGLLIKISTVPVLTGFSPAIISECSGTNGDGKLHTTSDEVVTILVQPYGLNQQIKKGQVGQVRPIPRP